MASRAKAANTTSVRRPGAMGPATAALVAAALLTSVGGGTMLDRVSIGRDADARSLYLVPLALLAVAAGLLSTFYARPRKPAAASGFGAVAAWAGLALGLWCTLSLAGTPCLQLGVYAGLVLSLALGAGILAAGSAGDRTSRTTLLLGLVGAASLVSAMGLNEYLVAFRGGDVTWRVFAGFNNPNLLAGYLAVILPVTTTLFLGARERSAALGLGTALALQSACLLLTQSRLGLVALAIGLVVTAILAGRSLLAGPARPRMLALAGLALLVLVVGARPLLKRLSLAGDQSYSARFRTETWRGTAAMALAHPLKGTGLGSFEVAYPRHAVVGYTQHAHSTYLQVAAEAGLPAALFLIAALACSGLAVYAGTRRAPSADTGGTAWTDIPEVLVGAGLAGAMATAIVHNLFDSDLYVPAIALMVGTLAGVAGSHQDSEAGTAPPWQRQAGFALVLLLGLGGMSELIGRSSMAAAWGAAMAHNPRTAADTAATAAIVEPFNVWNTMDTASFWAAAGDGTAADASYRRAIRQAPIAVTHYRYARWLEGTNRSTEALAHYEKSRDLDPINLGNLIHLAQSYRKAGRGTDASAVYRRLVQMENGPIGRLRAVPEVVEWEYGEAHLALAEDALATADRSAAIREIQAGVATLRELWDKRDVPQTMATTRPEVLDQVGDRLVWAYTQLQELLQGTPSAADCSAALAKLREERTARAGAAGGP